MNNPFIILCSGISTLLPFIVSTVIFKYLEKRPKTVLFLWIFFTLAVVTEITLFVFGSLGKQSAWIFHIYTFIEYILITMILVNWQNNSSIAKLMRISIPLYAIFFVFTKVVGLESFETGFYNNITRPLAVLLLCTFAFLTLQNLWSRRPANLISDYRFWMLLAMALYYSTSLGLFAFMFTKNRDLLVALFKIHAVVNILHNILFTIGVFQVKNAKSAALQLTSAS